MRAASTSAGAADEGDDLVDHAEGLHEALDDVLALLRLAQAVLGAAGHDLHLVRDVDEHRAVEREHHRHAVDERQHVGREVRLHRRVLVELVEHDVGVGVAAELDDEAGVSPADSLRTSRMPSIFRSFTSSAIFCADGLDRRLERDLGDDDAHLALRAFVDLRDGAHLDGAAARSCTRL